MDSFNKHLLDKGILQGPNSDINGNETILVVDDQKEIRSFLISALKMFGYCVICAEDGTDGLKKYVENRDKIHLLLLDIVMPKKNGVELFKEIKKLEPNAKVLFMSGYNEIFNKKENLQEDIKCISKPFTIKALLKEIREVLDK
jgi:DNA-binding NtrC family response regulator